MKEGNTTVEEAHIKDISQSYGEGVARLREEFLDRVAVLRARADEEAAKELGAAIRDKKETYGHTSNAQQEW